MTTTTTRTTRTEAPVAEDEPVDDAVETDTGPDTDAASRPPVRRSGRVPVAVVSVALLLCLVFGLFGALQWWRAGHDEGIDYARTRDQALVQAQQDIEVLNSLDHRSVDQGIARWRAVSSGTLLDQLEQVSKDDRRDLAAAGKVTTARVVDAALVDLDQRERTATVIASVEITVRSESVQTAVKRNRFTADLVRTGGSWKLTSLQQVSVNLQ